jgi:hypothetical protein
MVVAVSSENLSFSHSLILEAHFAFVDHAIFLSLLECEPADHSRKRPSKSLCLYHVAFQLLRRRWARFWQDLARFEGGNIGKAALVSVYKCDIVACQIILCLLIVVEFKHTAKLVGREVCCSSLIY